MKSFQETNDGLDRYLRTVTDNLWISVLHRLTGFGYWEWETAICTKEPHTCNIVKGDRREELNDLTEKEIWEWYAIHGDEKNSFETIMEAITDENNKFSA